MKYYIITDTHFGHEKIKDWCGRPNNFEDIILKRLGNIPSGCILIHLGDIAWHNVGYWNRVYLTTVNVHKHWLVKGNHDKNSNTWYYNKGWDFVGDMILLNQFGKRILLSHRPVEPGDWYDVNVHGHLHNTGHHATYDDGKHICVYIEHHYQAQNLQKIIGV